MLPRCWRLAALSFCLVLPGCRPTSQRPDRPAISKPSVAFPSDDLGRPVRLSKPARRIVVIGPGAVETVFALGAGAKLVGRDSSSDYPPQARRVPVAGDFSGPFAEKAVALRPDLVIVQGETYDRTRADDWAKKIGAPVAVLNAQTVAGVADGIKKMGAWLGARTTAPQLALALESAPEPVAGSPDEPVVSFKNLHPVPAFVEVERSPLWTAGQGTLLDDAMRRAKLPNVAGGVSGYKPYSLEALIASRKLQAYIVPMQKPDKARALRELRAHPTLGKLDSVRRGHVIVAHADWLLRPGPRLRQGIIELAQQAKQMTNNKGR